MNKKIHFGKLLLGVALCSAVITVSSCKKQGEPEDTKKVAKEVTDANTPNDSIGNAKEHDGQYMIAAAETDMMEIELAKLALQKSKNPGVKDLANMMIDQHTKASAALKPLAASKQVTLPASLTDKGKDACDDLGKKNGKDFDEAYADMMVKGHEDAISKIKDASENAKDAEVKKWATDMLPTLNTHLEHSKMLQDQIKKSK